MAQRLINAIPKKLVSFLTSLVPVRKPSGFVLLLRLENMPLLLDRLGQAGVTHLLVQLTIRLSAAIRPYDPVQVVAPGVFLIVLRSKSAADAMAIALRMQQCGQKYLAVAGQTVTPVLTGLLLPDDHPKSVEMASLINHGYQKLTELRSDRLGQITLIDPQLDHMPASLPVTVTQAAQMGQMLAYYQPKICCHTGAVTGFEVLARWKHASKGVLQPADFIPGMTDGDHRALTLSMLDQALGALTAWTASGYNVPNISINVSVSELNDPAFSKIILQDLQRHQHLPSALVIELLENVGPININAAGHANLREFRDAGCQLDLDDFGIGYASLDAVRSFGVNRIKIDRSFVTGCHNNPNQQRMVLGIFALAEQLGIPTIAEGMETAEEHSFLAQLGCSEVQGFAISRPMPFAETFAFLKTQKRREQELPIIPLRKSK